jgi:hypothetical protein
MRRNRTSPPSILRTKRTEPDKRVRRPETVRKQPEKAEGSTERQREYESTERQRTVRCQCRGWLLRNVKIM